MGKQCTVELGIFLEQINHFVSEKGPENFRNIYDRVCYQNFNVTPLKIFKDGRM